jgi:membrane protein implicated in regulation of membrane protease activity
MNITSAPIAWTLLALLLAVLEITAPVFVFASLAVAAGGAAAAAALGAPIEVQLIAFAVIALVVLVIARRSGARWLSARSPQRTNVDALPGEQALVATAIDNARDEGRVVLQGMDWSARSAPGTPIPAGTRVRVVRVDGVKLIVEPEPSEGSAEV